MKIERISENQIRCTLTHSDLESRELKLSELAYGTEKAKSFFHDMIEQASNDFGFEADEAPLMIEAIPVSGDCIVLVITRVDDPEELDNRFASINEAMESTDREFFPDYPDNIEDFEEEEDVDNFIPMSETLSNADKKKPEEEKPEFTTYVFSFKNWDDAALGSAQLDRSAVEESILFKSEKDIYYLFLKISSAKSDDNPEMFNLLLEYGHKERINYASLSYLTEHCRLIIQKDALRILSEY